MDIENTNLNFALIRLEDTNLFGDIKNDTVYRYFRQNNIFNLEQLFKAFENNTINLQLARNKTMERIMGIVDLILYKYLNISLKINIPYEKTFFNIDCQNETVYSTFSETISLSRMGFDRNEIKIICNVIGRCQEEITFIDILYYLRRETFKKSNSSSINEVKKFNFIFYNKLNLLINNYESLKYQEQVDENQESLRSVTYLVSRLDELEVAKQKIEFEIIKTQTELTKKIIEEYNGNTTKEKRIYGK